MICNVESDIRKANAAPDFRLFRLLPIRIGKRKSRKSTKNATIVLA